LITAFYNCSYDFLLLFREISVILDFAINYLDIFFYFLESFAQIPRQKLHESQERAAHKLADLWTWKTA